MIEVFKKFLLGTILFISFGIDVKSQDLEIIKSKYLKTNDSLFIFKPENYSIKSSFSLLYLLHGHSANYKSWSSLVDLQALANNYNMIIVCPDGLKSSWYINSPLQDSSQFEDFFFKELVPFIHSKLNINPAQVFISGASMGGYGSLWFFINHQNYFRSAGSTSGVVNLHHSGFKNTTLSNHLGTYSTNNKNFDRYSILNNIKLLAKINKPIIFDCGTEDYLYKSNKAMRDSCDFYKVNATYIAQPGKHTGGYWANSILAHFQYFNKLITDEKKGS